MLFQCWTSVEDGGTTLKQHCVNAPRDIDKGMFSSDTQLTNNTQFEWVCYDADNPLNLKYHSTTCC